MTYYESVAEQFSQGFNSLPTPLPGAGGVTPQSQPEPWYSNILATILGGQHSKVIQNLPAVAALLGFNSIVLPELIRNQLGDLSTEPVSWIPPARGSSTIAKNFWSLPVYKALLMQLAKTAGRGIHDVAEELSPVRFPKKIEESTEDMLKSMPQPARTVQKTMDIMPRGDEEE